MKTYEKYMKITKIYKYSKMNKKCRTITRINENSIEINKNKLKSS